MKLIENNMNNIELDGHVVVEAWRPTPVDWARFVTELTTIDKAHNGLSVVDCGGGEYETVADFITDQSGLYEYAMHNQRTDV